MSENDKRRMILDASLELIREKGFEGTRIIDIANRAGIGKGTVYSYFSSKEEVVATSVKDLVDRDFREVYDQVEQAGDFETKLRLFVRIHYALLQQYGPFMILFAEQRMKDQAETSPEMRAVMEEIGAEHNRRVREIVVFGIENGELREDLDPDLAATYILSVTLGHAFSMMKGCCGEEPLSGMTDLAEISADQIIELILKGIRREQEV